VPGTDLEVQALAERTLLEPAANCLLIVIEGQLIVDLPGGAFRVLEAGDSLMLPAATQLALQPVAGQAVLTWHHPR
jgi:glyoxylate utilization-related uncharacterized protein